MVLDGVGGELGRAALELLTPGGRILLFGFSSGEPTGVTTADLMRLGITASWALADAAGAHRAIEARDGGGKVVLVP
jgi:NADPH2:quinone reductase